MSREVCCRQVAINVFNNTYVQLLGEVVTFRKVLPVPKSKDKVYFIPRNNHASNLYFFSENLEETLALEGLSLSSLLNGNKSIEFRVNDESFCVPLLECAALIVWHKNFKYCRFGPGEYNGSFHTSRDHLDPFLRIASKEYVLNIMLALFKFQALSDFDKFFSLANPKVKQRILERIKIPKWDKDYTDFLREKISEDHFGKKREIDNNGEQFELLLIG